MKSGGNTGFAGVLGRVEEHKGNSVFDPFFAGKKEREFAEEIAHCETVYPVI